MITAVDTNVLLDVLIPGAPHGDASERALAEALRAGAVVISDPVYAELAVHFPEQGRLDRFLADTGLRLEPSKAEALYRRSPPLAGHGLGGIPIILRSLGDRPIGGSIGP